MKKVLSIALVLILVVALAVPSFAMSKAELMAVAAKAPAEYQQQINAVINEMTEEEAQAVNVTAVTSTAKELQSKLNAGTLTAADINSAVATIQAAAPSVEIIVTDFAINGTTVSARVDTKVDGKEVETVPYNISTSGSGSTTTVIKATGMSVATAAIVLAIAISGVFGFAIVKSRKEAACA